MTTKIERIRRLLDKNRDAMEIVTEIGCLPSQVYHEIKRRKDNDEAREMVPRVAPPTPPKKDGPPLTILSIEVRLPTDKCAEIKLRNGGDNLLGTLVLGSDGIRYRRPNQKSAADRKLSWATLEKLMQLGIA
jgi:hypothetical protein